MDHIWHSTGPEEMKWGWKLKVNVIVTLRNLQTGELISRAVDSPNTIYTLYIIKEGSYTVEKIEFLSEGEVWEGVSLKVASSPR
jgi:hypothetical protein